MKYGFLFMGFGLILSAPSSAVSKVSTPMGDITEEYNVPCSSELRSLAQASLKTNPHRMLEYSTKKNDIHLFNAFAVTQYRDRDSHVSFHGVKNSQGSCDTSVTESYVLQTNCADARNEAFSKWNYEGQLTAHTMVLKSKRIKGKEAFLTDQFTTFCLVTTRQLVANPAH